MREAIIFNILKEGKDPVELDAYHPISLIMADANIQAKVLANRLQRVAGGLISKDQTAFISTKTMSDNIWHLFRNIPTPIEENKSEAILILDAMKAFDRVEWSYLWQVMRKMGFGPSFLGWVKLMYANTTARIRLNNTSQAISIQKGNETGLPPLSPLVHHSYETAG